MKPNRNRSRDLGFYIIMLAILITVVMLLTKQPTPNQIENYSELAGQELPGDPQQLRQRHRA